MKFMSKETVQISQPITPDIPWEGVIERTTLPDNFYLALIDNEPSRQRIADLCKDGFFESRYFHSSLYGLVDREVVFVDTVTLGNGLRYPERRRSGIVLQPQGFSPEERRDHSPYYLYNGRQLEVSSVMSDAPFEKFAVTKHGNDQKQIEFLIDSNPTDGMCLGDGWSCYGFTEADPAGRVLKKVKYTSPDGSIYNSSEFNYTINPRERQFAAVYEYVQNDRLEKYKRTVTIYMNLPNHKAEVIRGTPHTPNSTFEVHYTESIDERNRGDVKFFFQNDGKIARIELDVGHVNSMDLRDNDFVNEFFRAGLGVDFLDKNAVVIQGDSLKKESTRRFIRQYLGVELNDKMRLDIKESLTNLVENIDTDDPTSPEKMLVYCEN